MANILPTVTETGDAAATTATTYSLGVGESAQGTIAALGDHDWYAINLVAGLTYTIAEIGTNTNALRDPFLNLRNSSGTVIASDDNSGPALSSQITITPATTGTYYIDAGARGDSSTGGYGISLTAGSHASFDIPMGGGAIDAYDTWGTRGAAATVSYGFRMDPASYTVSGSNISTFTQCSAAEMAAVQTILGLWSSVCNVTFTQVNPGGFTNNATILIGNYNDLNDGAGAFAFYPGSTSSSSSAGDLWLNLGGGISTTSIPPGSYSFLTILHELGHALGLSHPGDYNAAPGVSITYASNAQFVQDSEQYSVMSYFGGSNTGENPGGFGTAYTPMMLDIYELQQLYGANTSTRAGDTTYGFNSNAGSLYAFVAGTTPQYCIWDGGGTDTLDCSHYSGSQIINLNPGTFSSVDGGASNISIALGVTIENAVGGSGNDTFYLSAANVNNVIDGGLGTDTVYLQYAYHSGYTIQSGSTAADIVMLGPEGIDTFLNDDTFHFIDGTTVSAASLVSATLPPVQHDFNGDGTSDLLLQNGAGSISEMLVQNGTVTNWSVLANITGWTATATGDVNNDGTSDILLQNGSGLVSELLVQNATVTGWNVVANSFGWTLAGTGDFNHDGTSDLLFQNTNATISQMPMQNGAATDWNVVAIAPGWSIKATGDLNSDGTSDILLQNTSGTISEMLMQNGAETAWNVLANASGWSVKATADFNNDGTFDILLQNNAGTISEMLMQNGAVTAWNVLANAAGWSVIDTGDLHHNGGPDILLQNSAGTISDMIVQNGTVTDWHVLASSAGWTLIA